MQNKLALAIFLDCLLTIPALAEQKKIYTFCASEKKEWHWLKNENDNYIQFTGEIKPAIAYSDDWIENYNFEYFEIQEKNALEKIKHLQQLCQKNFGERFQIIQPAFNRFSPWRLFAFTYENEVYFTSGYYGNYYEISQKITNSEINIKTFSLEFNNKPIIKFHDLFKSSAFIINLNTSIIK